MMKTVVVTIDGMMSVCDGLGIVLGSTACGVVMNAPCTVMVVR